MFDDSYIAKKELGRTCAER